MPSRQDQLHSYQYSMQRVVAALVTHDPDPHRSPLRRAGTTALVSLLIAALAVGGAGVYGLLTGNSSTEATNPDVVLQEKGSGARYVYLKSDGRLHPVLNYASGLLLAGGDRPQLKTISADKLAKVQLGAPLGIPGAPDSLPSSRNLLTGGWSLCSDNEGAGGAARSTLLVGHAPSDGTVLSADKRALLVRDKTGRSVLVFDNRRFEFPAQRQDAILRSLGWIDQRFWPASVAWVNALPAGPDLRPPAVPGRGQESTVEGKRVGDLISNGGTQFAVVLSDGIAGITPMQARLLAAEWGAPIQAIGSEFLRPQKSKIELSDAGDPDGLPSIVPELAQNPARACLTLPVDGASGAGVRLDPTVPSGTAVSGATTPNAASADLVHIARGKGALVVNGGTVSLVTDTGRAYRLAHRGLLGKLGYGNAQPRPIPTQLIDLLPIGPTLDPEQALVPGGAEAKGP